MPGMNPSTGDGRMRKVWRNRVTVIFIFIVYSSEVRVQSTTAPLYHQAGSTSIVVSSRRPLSISTVEGTMMAFAFGSAGTHQAPVYQITRGWTTATDMLGTRCHRAEEGPGQAITTVSWSRHRPFSPFYFIAPDLSQPPLVFWLEVSIGQSGGVVFSSFGYKSMYRYAPTTGSSTKNASSTPLQTFKTKLETLQKLIFGTITITSSRNSNLFRPLASLWAIVACLRQLQRF